MPLKKAGEAILEFGTKQDMPLVEFGDDGKCKLKCEDDGRLKSIDPKMWRITPRFQKAAIYRP